MQENNDEIIKILIFYICIENTKIKDRYCSSKKKSYSYYHSIKEI
jgi:hypothetical protein